ncbi:integrase core domain-containing protein [Streptomyces sp. NRRL S-813]|uniref:integrase core domain-containing protein n=1 Tax=Streptomyces sp. NRRL S-813 TaxID=1463919 RepID=UPI00099B7367
MIKPQRPWRSLAQVELATAEWSDWYNHTRLHGEIGHLPPAVYEANHYLSITKAQVMTNIRDLGRTRNSSVWFKGECFLRARLLAFRCAGAGPGMAWYTGA